MLDPKAEAKKRIDADPQLRGDLDMFREVFGDGVRLTYIKFNSDGFEVGKCRQPTQPKN